MPLPTVFETQEALNTAIPEGLREHYKERDGKFYLEVDKPEVVATGLAKNRDDLLKEKKAVADKLAALEGRFKGKTPEEIEALIEAASQKETEDAKKEGNLDKVIQKFNEDKKKLEDSHKADVDRLTAQLNKFKIDDRLSKAALEGGVIKEIVGDVVDLIRARTQLTDADDLLILDKPGGDPLSVSVERFFSDVFKNERPHYYEATGAGGSGATNGTHKKLRGVDLSKLPASERLKAAHRTETR